MANNTNVNLVYKKLRALRKSLDGSAKGGGMTQTEFAAWLSEKRDYAVVTQSMVSNFENKNKCISKANDRWLRGIVGMKGAV